ncbi:unnamed protein product [Nesidiocoris tenuis]|uniref:Uncharacterized protein n=1 Tax=Nesidiocoris tenuis TaxID=355587 RepID=A0A6H5H1E3_9HEMI|nr:unnamed protein product [Nesidiocoris tenuis]
MTHMKIIYIKSAFDFQLGNPDGERFPIPPVYTVEKLSGKSAITTGRVDSKYADNDETLAIVDTQADSDGGCV